jgi:predicted RNA binding protein YcfA (HicA-like mRNA interferase family)
MKTPRNLSGKELASVLVKKWGYSIVHQTGSHIVLVTAQPSHQRISIPAHKAVRIGTLEDILKEVATHKRINKQDILRSI